MDAVDLLDREAVHDAFAHHHLATAAILFRRLEQEHHGTGHIFTVLRQHPSSAKQHGDMAIVPARVHFPGVLGCMWKFIAFLDWQCIHVSPQANRFSRTQFAFKRADYTCFTHASFDLIAKFAQSRGDNVGGAVFLIAQFRVGVDVSAGVYPALNFAWSHNLLH